MGKHESDRNVEHKREAWYPGKEDAFEGARKDTYDRGAVQTQENFGKKTEASKKTVEVVGMAIENSDLLPAADKKVADTMARAIAEGDTGRLQDCIDKFGQTDDGRQRLKEIVKELDNIYDDNGFKDIQLRYPVDAGHGKSWELEVSGESKGIQQYVYFKPGERPVSSTSSGTQNTFDLGDGADTDKSQEKRSAKALRLITQHSQEDL